jgi:hypothetical protein
MVTHRVDRGVDPGDRHPRFGRAMIGLDTNVLVRYIVDRADVVAQALRVCKAG